MFRFFLFIKRIHYVLLFVVLMTLSLHLFRQSSEYSRAKMAAVSNIMIGGFADKAHSVRRFVNLGEENKALSLEIIRLRKELNNRPLKNQSGVDQPMFVEGIVADSCPPAQYDYQRAQVVNNTFTRQYNYITLDRGALAGVTKDMAIVEGNAIVGYVVRCSPNFAIGISLLNRDFKTSGRIIGDDYTGSIWWDGTSAEYVTFSDIPKYAKIEVGDTVVTTRYSSIFPADLMIGTIEKFDMVDYTSFTAKVKLRARMSSLSEVLLINNRSGEEQRQLENSQNTAQPDPKNKGAKP